MTVTDTTEGFGESSKECANSAGSKKKKGMVRRVFIVLLLALLCGAYSSSSSLLTLSREIEELDKAIQLTTDRLMALSSVRLELVKLSVGKTDEGGLSAAEVKEIVDKIVTR